MYCYNLGIPNWECLSDNMTSIIMEVNHMKRPSIFSKDYDKEVKRRKKVIVLVIIVSVIGLSIFLTTGFNGLLNKGISIKKGINSIFVNKSKDDKAAEVVKQQPNSLDAKAKQAENAAKAKLALKAKANAESKNFIVSLTDGQKITIEYNATTGDKTIKGVANAKNISYDISPSKKAIVLQSTNNQDMLYVNVNKVSKDITRKIYTSSKNENYMKDQQLKNSPDYIWSITPKFIDEDNIAYVSELPWMNEKKQQYIWKVNLKDNINMQVNPASGTKITFKNATAKGLEATIDGEIVYVTALGEVTK